VFRTFALLLVLSSAAPIAGTTVRAAQERPAHPSFESTVRPFVERHCLACHGNRVKTAGLSLEAYTTAEQALGAPELWRRIGRRIRGAEMPPAPMPRPDPAEAAAVVRWLEAQLGGLEETRVDPGRVTARRLNRVEYDNTVRDLLGVSFHPADDFPADDVGYGFDNIGDVLTMSPILLEKYLAAAEKIAAAAIPRAVTAEPTADQYVATGPRHEFTHDFPARAEYEIFVNVIGKRAKELPQQTLTVSLDGREIGSFAVEQSKIDTGANRNPGFTLRLRIEPGKRRVAAALSAPGESPVTRGVI
jgi:cytochrome c551/c552